MASSSQSLMPYLRGNAHAPWSRFVRRALLVAALVVVHGDGATTTTTAAAAGGAGAATADDWQPKLPAILMLGDSIVDPGNNNNNRITEAKVNFPPYGQDFPGGVATGRFSNGFVPGDLFGTCVEY